MTDYGSGEDYENGTGVWADKPPLSQRLMAAALFKTDFPTDNLTRFNDTGVVFDRYMKLAETALGGIIKEPTDAMILAGVMATAKRHADSIGSSPEAVLNLTGKLIEADVKAVLVAALEVM